MHLFKFPEFRVGPEVRRHVDTGQKKTSVPGLKASLIYVIIHEDCTGAKDQVVPLTLLPTFVVFVGLVC